MSSERHASSCVLTCPATLPPRPDPTAKLSKWERSLQLAEAARRSQTHHHPPRVPNPPCARRCGAFLQAAAPWERCGALLPAWGLPAAGAAAVLPTLRAAWLALPAPEAATQVREPAGASQADAAARCAAAGAVVCFPAARAARLAAAGAAGATARQAAPGLAGLAARAGPRGWAAAGSSRAARAAETGRPSLGWTGAAHLPESQQAERLGCETGRVRVRPPAQGPADVNGALLGLKQGGNCLNAGSRQREQTLLAAGKERETQTAPA